MKLLNLTVFKNLEVLRSIDFFDGLNLILNVDSNRGKSGNSVGKTTLSRLLDYIFLSSGEDIYKAPEFNKSIPEVHGFIEENDILVRLQYEGVDGKKYEVTRQLVTEYKKSRFFLGTIEKNVSEYTKHISETIFGLKGDKPSIRNVSHKFIRNTHDKMQNTTRFLHTNTKPDIYDQVYLFLFGFKGLSALKEKASIVNRIKTRKKHLAAYRTPHKESALEKMKKPLEVEAKEIEKKIKDFNFQDSNNRGVEELVGIQSEISDLTIAFANYEAKVDYLKKSIKKFKNKATDADGEELHRIYEQAGISISSGLKRKYTELAIFHNKLIANKISLLDSELAEVENASKNIIEKIRGLQKKETEVFKDISEPDVLRSIGQLYNSLSNVKENIVRVSTSLSKIEDTKSEIENLESLKSNFIEIILSEKSDLENNIEIFNKFFGDYSKNFYDERYIFDLAFDADAEKCYFDIACISPSPTGGKKKGELSAFDLAYIDFVIESKLDRPTFVVHDSIEDVDINQVFDIFQQANKSSGQYIVSVLSDKISESRFSNFKRESVILELSDSDKFFRI